MKIKARVPALIITILLIANCTTDNNPASRTTRELSPPEWILGDWKDRYDVMKYEFSQSNVIMFSLETEISVDFRKNFVGGTLTEKVKNENEYRISATYTNMKQEYRFAKKSDTTLDYYLIMTDDTHPEDSSGGGPIPLIKE